MGVKCNLDKFYTKKEICKYLIQKLNKELNLQKFDLIIEPSAGNGSFLNFLPLEKTQAYDLLPEADNIIQQDWLTFSIPNNFKNVFFKKFLNYKL